MRVLKKLFSFQGRITGGEYALVSIVSFAAMLMVRYFLPTVAIAWSLQAAGVPEDTAISIGMAAFLLLIPLLWIYFAAAVKREHDRGRSGWWSLLLFIPLANFFVWLIDLVFGEGEYGRNEYGPDPRGREHVKPVAEVFD